MYDLSRLTKSELELGWSIDHLVWTQESVVDREPFPKYLVMKNPVINGRFPFSQDCKPGDFTQHPAITEVGAVGYRRQAWIKTAFHAASRRAPSWVWPPAVLRIREYSFVHHF